MTFIGERMFHHFDSSLANATDEKVSRPFFDFQVEIVSVPLGNYLSANFLIGINPDVFDAEKEWARTRVLAF